jgi:threonine dehydratase
MKRFVEAQERLRPILKPTPLLLWPHAKHEIWLKCEIFQPTGSFKVRGATNTLLKAQSEHRLTGTVKTVSSGNHAQAVAWASRLTQQKSIVFMSRTASEAKIHATRALGAELHLCETRSEANERVEALREGLFVPPFDHEDVISGQGTACLEAFQERGIFDAIFTPCGGGGLLSGTLLVAKHLSFDTKVFGIEPCNANDAAISLKSGKLFHFDQTPPTICDGIQSLGLSERTFNYVKASDGILTIEDTVALEWSYRLLQTMKLTVEPSSAIALAGAMSWLDQQIESKKVMVLLSGGNIDLLRWKAILKAGASLTP